MRPEVRTRVNMGFITGGIAGRRKYPPVVPGVTRRRAPADTVPALVPGAVPAEWFPPAAGATRPGGARPNRRPTNGPPPAGQRVSPWNQSVARRPLTTSMVRARSTGSPRTLTSTSVEPAST